MPVVPFKANAACRHHIPKQRYRVTNWAEYDASLRQRGSLTIWFTEEAMAAWRAEPRRTRGGQPHYSTLAIRTALTLRAVFRLALRQTDGTRRRRAWRKLHIGVNAETGQILASELTASDVDDGSQVEPLLDQIATPLASFIADGAYDQAGIYGIISKHHTEADVIIPPRSTAVLSDGVQTTPTQRDRHLQSIAEHGRMGWQKASGYNQRALVESAIDRLKRVIGDALRSRTDRRCTIEIAIAVHALNRMLELGRPKSVRI